MKNKTLVLGASDNPGRYSNMAMLQLQRKGHDVVPVGKKAGTVNGMDIQTTMPQTEDIDTVTLYLNPDHQKAYYDQILMLRPRRIIFNPGTENEELEEMAAQNGIKVMEACTLVMLNTGQY
ncbi:CoA-binding protein [Nemorincola caseinilytica]|uniref:CoA-binding protein n=1 Tax=Nemorincola caseinilytica TaxID=2054315 RepID=A0ABP8NBU9_9BACT